MLPTIATGNVGSALAGEYEVANSLRFNRASSDYLSRTQTSGSRRKATFSAWVKGAYPSSYAEQMLMSSGGNMNIYWDSGSFRINTGTGDYAYSTALFRDPSAWYNFCVAIDTEQSTASNRIKMYVNGTQITSFTHSSYPSEDEDLNMNVNSETFYISKSAGTSYGNYYLAEVVWVDGQQLDADQFGEFDSDTNIWKPIDVSGLTFGNNGFYLDFENSGSLGADVSGNSNNFTVNNLTSVDQSASTCTNNEATLNSLSSNSTFSEGNLQNAFGGSGSFATASSTIGVTQGKWFCELKITVDTNYPSTGICATNSSHATRLSSDDWLGRTADSYGIYTTSGHIYNNGSIVSTFSSIATNDIIGMALDLDSSQNTLKYYKNGSLIGTQNITTNVNGYMFASTNQSTGTTNTKFNFGSPPYSESGGNSDGNGYGNFSMAVPSGYFALNTKNLAEYG
jgi:hypothetical protein